MDDAAAPEARAAADRLIRFRPRSEQELRARLRQKGFDPAAIDTVVQSLARQDLLDDRKFARYVATSRLMARPMGLRALREELRRKGVAAETAAQAVTAASADYDEFEAARALALRRLAQLRGVPPAAVQRRLAGLLQRRGFPGDVVFRVVKEIVRNDSLTPPSPPGGEGTGEGVDRR
ncbi:MAG: regulatory protein RecX [Candidatus Omnitrophica bacterium]|nr:regulatory protein RecX [Candidatus Omnitrophota bacterium]